jgi:hypothetical protein
MPETEAVNVRTGETVTTEEPGADEALIESLKRERAGYVQRDLPDRVAAVDAELKRLGHTRADAHAGTERAVSKPAETRRRTTK